MIGKLICILHKRKIIDNIIIMYNNMYYIYLFDPIEKWLDLKNKI